MPAPFDFVNKNGYDHEFFGCCRDPLYCLASFFIPCLVVGKVTGEIEGGSFNVVSCCCTPLGALRNRRKIQDSFNHHESEDGTILAIGCCPCCAIAQDAHEWSTRRPTQPASTPAVPPVTVEVPTTSATTPTTTNS